MEIISKDVKKVYKIKSGLFKTKKLEVVKCLNYTIKQGEIIALMGMASSGKSTVVNLLSGRDLPTNGKIYVDGEVDYKRLKECCETISDLRSKKLLVNESVYNNLMAYGNKLRIDSFDIEKRIVELRDALELEKVINKKISELNELDEIKVRVAVSMLNNPMVVFFDNALIGLNPIIKNTLLKILKRINKEFKTTIVIASVDLMDIEKICKRVSVVQNGEIVLDGDFDSIKDKYWNEKNVSIIFNKSFNAPKGDFEILEMSDYFLKIRVDFSKCDFASLIKQFDINTIIDISISSSSLVNF